MMKTMAPGMAVVVYMLAGNGVAAQEALTDLLARTHVHGLAVDAQDGDRLLIATHHGLFAYGLSSGAVGQVSRTTDDFMGFSPDPTKPGTLLASGHPSAGGNLGVIASQDGGLSWTKLSDGVGGPVDFHAMEVSRADAQVVYGAYAGTLQTSRDGGGTWTIVGPAPARLIDIATSTRNADILFAATEAGLLRSTDRGVTWAQAFPSEAPVTLVDIGTDGRALAFVLGIGLVQADETALDWAILSNAFGDGYLLQLARDPDEPMRMYAVSGAAEMMASQDGGATWASVASP